MWLVADDVDVVDGESISNVFWAFLPNRRPNDEKLTPAKITLLLCCEPRDNHPQTRIAEIIGIAGKHQSSTNRQTRVGISEIFDL